MRYAPALVVILCVAACAPLTLYHRPGVSVAQMQNDTLACEVQALRDAPVANQVRQDPPRFVPPRQNCDSAGTCTTRPGYWLPGQVFTVDVNAELRQRVETQCMAAKGYAPVSILPCPQSVSDAAPSGATRTLPRITDRSCVIRNSDGTFQIVTRG